MTLTNEEREDIQELALNRASAFSLTEWIEGLTTQLAEARRPALDVDDPVWQGAVGAMANMADFINNGKTTLADSDVANLKALLALDLSLIGKAFAALDAAQEARVVSEPTTCPNCGTDKVKFHVRQYDCRTCYPLGRLYPVGTDIDRADHRHWSCANGHRWADSA